MENYGVLIPADGLFAQAVEANENEKVMDYAYRVIGCDLVDNPRTSLSEEYCMFVDDEGLLTENPRPNMIASYLYGFCEHGQSIVGNAVVLRDVETDDGYDSTFMSKEEAERLAEELNSQVKPIFVKICEYVQRGAMY